MIDLICISYFGCKNHMHRASPKHFIRSENNKPKTQNLLTTVSIHQDAPYHSKSTLTSE